MRILIGILEDESRRTETMRQAIETTIPGATLHFVDNAPEMIQWFTENLDQVALLSLDHDLDAVARPEARQFDPGTGRDVVDFLVTRAPTCPVILHSSNSEAVYGMKSALEEAGWRTERVVPFADLAWVDEEWLPKLCSLLARIG
jgi:hypothetical protein